MAGTFALALNVAGDMTIHLGNAQEIRFATGATGRTHSIGGNLNVQNGIVVGNNGTGSAAVSIGGNLNITGGTFRGTNDAGNATFNIGGNISNGGAWQQDDGSSKGRFAVDLNGLASAQTVGGTNPISFEDLTISNALGCTVNQDVQVTGLLALTNGDINTGANTLILNEAATTSGIGDVWGNTKRSGTLVTGKTYSFGNPNVSLNFASGTPPAEITVNLASGAPAGFAKAVDRSYTIAPNGGSGYSATVRLCYRDTELGANTENQLHLWRHDGTTWVGQMGAVDTVNNHVVASDVTAFSPWAVASNPPAAITLRTLSAVSPNPTPASIGGLALLGGLAVFMRRRKA